MVSTIGHTVYLFSGCCNLFSGLKKIKWMIRSVLYLFSGVILIHIPKCGGISVNRALYRFSLGHVSVSEVRKHVPAFVRRRCVYLFIVRRPEERLRSQVSHFLNGGGRESILKVGSIDCHGLSALQKLNERSLAELIVQCAPLRASDQIFNSQSSYVVEPKNDEIFLIYTLSRFRKLFEIPHLNKKMSDDSDIDIRKFTSIYSLDDEIYELADAQPSGLVLENA